MFLFFHYFSSLLNICGNLKDNGGSRQKFRFFKNWKLLGAKMKKNWKHLEASSYRIIKENLP